MCYTASATICHMVLIIMINLYRAIILLLFTVQSSVFAALSHNSRYNYSEALKMHVAR